jgi:hypothetical protein
MVKLISFILNLLIINKFINFKQSLPLKYKLHIHFIVQFIILH